MKLILVPCDFSKQSVEALKFAAEIAPAQEAEIRLLNSIELPVLRGSSAISGFEQTYMKDLRMAALAKLNQLADRWVKGAAKTTPEVEFGSLVKTIERSIDLYGAGLVVMGTQGASGIKEYTIGSNTEKVVRNVSVPVITVRKSVKKISNIVYPVRPEEGLDVITRRVKQLQAMFNAKLHVLYVNTPVLFSRDADTTLRLESFAKKHSLNNYTLNIINDVSEVEGIINFTADIKDPMIAMRTHGRKGITHLVASSVAEDVVNHSECPVWTLKVK